MRKVIHFFSGVVLTLMVGFNAFVFAALTLPDDITSTGMSQLSLYNWMSNVQDIVNELQADHATNKTTIDETRTAVMELIDDHDADRSGIITDLKTLVNSLRTKALNQPLDPPNFEIASNFDIQNGDALDLLVSGKIVTVSTDQSFDTGTSTVVTTNAYWAGGILSTDGESATPTTYVDWGAEGVDESTAISNLSAVTASGSVVLGYVTVQAAAGQDWVAGTDALKTGAGGQVAQNTNYYNIADVGDAALGAAVSSSPAAALSAGDPTASAAALTNSTALKFTKD